METDQALEAEAELDTIARNRSSSTYSKWRGRDPVQTAAGGFESHGDIGPEEIPLLPESPTQESSDSDGSTYIGDTEPNSQEWSGAHDFDGLPWWKKPSVSVIGIGNQLHGKGRH